MKNLKLITALCVIALCIHAPIRANAQAGWVAKMAGDLAEALIRKGGQQGAKELTELGGETLAREALEKAAQEGGEKLAQRVADLALEHGAALLKVAKQSPSKFVSVFDELTPAMQKAAAQAITREPDRMARLFSTVGKQALKAAALHPGVGSQVVEALGPEGAEALGRVRTDQAIQLGRLAPKIAGVAEPQRRTLMEMIEQAPERIMDLLEKHPKVLLTGAGLASFIAAKEQILGGAEIITDRNGVVRVVEKPGFLQRTWRQTTETFKTPLSSFLCIAGLIALAWGGIKVWAAVRLEKAKVRIKEAQMSQEARREREQSHQ
jgi:hypothetical protein